MILADTSIVVEFLRSADPKLRGLIVSKSAAVCGVTRTEILFGARDALHRQKLYTALNMFQQLPFPEKLWNTSGDYLASLRAAGVTLPLADVLIAAVAIENGVELWTRDQHYSLMQKVIPGLRLFEEPP